MIDWGAGHQQRRIAILTRIKKAPAVGGVPLGLWTRPWGNRVGFAAQGEKRASAWLALDETGCRNISSDITRKNRSLLIREMIGWGVGHQQRRITILTRIKKKPQRQGEYRWGYGPGLGGNRVGFAAQGEKRASAWLALSETGCRSISSDITRKIRSLLIREVSGWGVDHSTSPDR